MSERTPERGNSGFNKIQELVDRMKDADPDHANGWEELGDFADFLARHHRISRSAVDTRREKITPIEDAVFEHPYFDFDLRGHTITVDGVVTELTKMNYDLLKYLIENRNRFVSRTELMENVWENYALPKTIDVHVAGLRKLFKGDKENMPDVIRTKIGVGYMLYDERTDPNRLD